jgi:ABC-type multidrug transport system ATPase subunit
MLGVVPESRGFYNWMTAGEYLSFFASLYIIKKNEAKERIEALLVKVDLISNKNKHIGAYSRGMKQRLGLARAMINNPRILILDEPTLGLDPKGQEDMHNLLRELNKSGVTIFYSSHVLQEVADLCHKVAIINHGQLVAEGNLPELLQSTKSATLTEVFLSLTQDEHD